MSLAMDFVLRVRSMSKEKEQNKSEKKEKLMCVLLSNVVHTHETCDFSSKYVKYLQLIVCIKILSSPGSRFCDFLIVLSTVFNF
jgi:hypothetical protein